MALDIQIVKKNDAFRKYVGTLADQGWKRNKLAKAMGRAPSWLTRYLAGIGVADLDQIERLEQYFGTEFVTLADKIVGLSENHTILSRDSVVQLPPSGDGEPRGGRDDAETGESTNRIQQDKDELYRRRRLIQSGQPSTTHRTTTDPGARRPKRPKGRSGVRKRTNRR